MSGLFLIRLILAAAKKNRPVPLQFSQKICVFSCRCQCLRCSRSFGSVINENSTFLFRHYRVFQKTTFAAWFEILIVKFGRQLCKLFVTCGKLFGHLELLKIFVNIKSPVDNFRILKFLTMFGFCVGLKCKSWDLKQTESLLTGCIIFTNLVNRM